MVENIQETIIKYKAKKKLPSLWGYRCNKRGETISKIQDAGDHLLNLKIKKFWYLRNGLTNFDKIWHDDVSRPSRLTPTANKILWFQKSNMAGPLMHLVAGTAYHAETDRIRLKRRRVYIAI